MFWNKKLEEKKKAQEQEKQILLVNIREKMCQNHKQ